MLERTKVCANPECALAGTPQPWSAFYAKTRWPDGTMRQPHSRCRACKDAQRRTPEGRAYYRAYRRGKRDDPAIRNRELRLQRKRWKRGARERRRQPRLPVEPFAEWLLTLAPGWTEISRVTELPPETVRYVLRGRKVYVNLDTVDRACLAAGISIDTIYPEE